MEKRFYAVMAGLVLCLSLSIYAVSENLLERYKVKQKEIALLEKTGDKAALEKAKQELATLFNQHAESSEPDYSAHAEIHQTYLDTKAALQELNKEVEFFSSVVFKYNVLTLQEQLLFDEIKAFIETKNASMIQRLQQCYEQWSVKLDDQTTQTFMHDAPLINNHIQLISRYFKTIKMVRMQLELLTLDNRSVTTLATPIHQMLRDDELQSACLKIATKLFELLCTHEKKSATSPVQVKSIKQEISWYEVTELLTRELPARFHDSWWQRWGMRAHTVRALLFYARLSLENQQAWCDEYLRLQKACTHHEMVADKKVYQETINALDALYRDLYEQIEDLVSSQEEKRTYKIFLYKVLMMKKDLKKFEHYQYDVAKEGIAAKHAVLIEQESFKKVAVTKELAPLCDQYLKVIDLYLYNQTKPSLLMFELYKLATQLKVVKERYKLSKVMWLFFKEDVVCHVIDDMITLLEYIALDISNSKGFEKNSIIEHILAGAWATHNGGLMQKKSFFSDIAHKVFGTNDTDVKNQMLKTFGYAGPIVAGAALKMLMPYLTDESKDQKSDHKGDEKVDAQKDLSKFLESLMSQGDLQQQL